MMPESSYGALSCHAMSTGAEGRFGQEVFAAVTMNACVSTALPTAVSTRTTHLSGGYGAISSAVGPTNAGRGLEQPRPAATARCLAATDLARSCAPTVPSGNSSTGRSRSLRSTMAQSSCTRATTARAAIRRICASARRPRTFARWSRRSAIAPQGCAEKQTQQRDSPKILCGCSALARRAAPNWRASTDVASRPSALFAAVERGGIFRRSGRSGAFLRRSAGRLIPLGRPAHPFQRDTPCDA